MNTIHSWEKTLSLINETVDYWINFTQRKWLHLEGVFINNRTNNHLNDIADKFDQIDMEYLKVYLCARIKGKMNHHLHSFHFCYLSC